MGGGFRDDEKSFLAGFFSEELFGLELFATRIVCYSTDVVAVVVSAQKFSWSG